MVRILALSLWLLLVRSLFSQSISNPALADKYLAQGAMELLHNHFHGALWNFDRVMQLDPQNQEVYQFRAETYLRMGDFERALGEFNLAIRYNPQAYYLYNSRGKALENLNQWQLAQEDFDQARRLNPGFTEADRNYYRAQTHAAASGYRGADLHTPYQAARNRSLAGTYRSESGTDAPYPNGIDGYAPQNPTQQALDQYNRSLAYTRGAPSIGTNGGYYSAYSEQRNPSSPVSSLDQLRGTERNIASTPQYGMRTPSAPQRPLSSVNSGSSGNFQLPKTQKPSQPLSRGLSRPDYSQENRSSSGTPATRSRSLSGADESPFNMEEPSTSVDDLGKELASSPYVEIGGQSNHYVTIEKIEVRSTETLVYFVAQNDGVTSAAVRIPGTQSISAGIFDQEFKKKYKLVDLYPGAKDNPEDEDLETRSGLHYLASGERIRFALKYDPIPSEMKMFHIKSGNGENALNFFNITLR